MFARCLPVMGLVLAGCSPAPASLAPAPLGGAATGAASRDHSLAGYEAHFWLTWNGARIGDASESLRRHGDGLRFERRQRVSVRRGATVVHDETAITITTGPDLDARDIFMRQISGDVLIQGRAHREPGGDWQVMYADEPERVVPGAAMPAELVPLWLAAHPDASAFSGPVILSGYSFATARLRVVYAGQQTMIATLRTRHGVSRGRMALTRQGTVARVMGDDGIGAVRVSADEINTIFMPPEIVESSSVPVMASGTVNGSGGSEVLVIEPVDRALPPPLPGQQVEARGRVWRIFMQPGDAVLENSPAGWDAVAGDAGDAAPDSELAELAGRIVADVAAGDARGQVVALVRATAELVADDLAVQTGSARAALALGRGDCTAHAALFAGLARARGFAVRLVTGFRLDGDRLVRHRWAIVRVDGAWMAVDPTYAEAPAAPRLIGLAVHDVWAADIAMADSVAFVGFSGARAAW